jgi:hypothetical protein
MKNSTKLRKLFLAAAMPLLAAAYFLFSGVECATGKSCSELWEEWDQANMTYTARYESAYYGVPTTCAQDCQNVPQHQQAQCISDCQIERKTLLAQASINLFVTAGRTCVPYSMPECEMARYYHDSCLLNYRYWEIEDPEQSMDLFEQYYACRIASKVDFCA